MPENNFQNQGNERFKTDDADSYDAVVEHFDRYTQRFASHLPVALLAMAKLPANARVLDVGTGTGVVPLTLADKVGAEGKVVGIDLSDAMLEMSRKKALLKGLQSQTEFLKMDAENLDFPDNHFDAAFSLYALHHFPNPGKALEEIYRVLKPGANAVVAVGSAPDLLSINGFKAALRKISSVWRQSTGRELSACGFIDRLVRKHIHEGADRDVTEWAEHSHGYSGSLADLVRATGFTNIRKDWKGQYSCITTADDFWFLQMIFSSTARKRIQRADDKMLRSLKTEFDQCCDQVLKKNGRLVYQSGAAIVAGIKPGQYQGDNINDNSRYKK